MRTTCGELAKAVWRWGGVFGLMVLTTVNAQEIKDTTYAYDPGGHFPHADRHADDKHDADPEAFSSGDLNDGMLGSTNFEQTLWVGVNNHLDDGNPQPSIVFDLGLWHRLDSIKTDYLVDHEGAVYAPDGVTITTSLDGMFGTEDRVVSSSAFDDSPDPASLGVGDVRSLTVDLDGEVTRFVKLQFLNDGSWTFLCEVTFNGVPAQGRIEATMYAYDAEGHLPKADRYPDDKHDADLEAFSSGDLNDSLLGNTSFGHAPWVGVDNHVDDGNPQPSIVFDLGLRHRLASDTIDYLVDHEAGVCAPDSIVAVLSTNSAFEIHDPVVTGSAFDDSPDPPSLGVGDVRSLTLDLDGEMARFVKLQFLNDGSWTFLCEVAFNGALAEPKIELTTYAYDADGHSPRPDRHADDKHDPDLQAFSGGDLNDGLVGGTNYEDVLWVGVQNSVDDGTPQPSLIFDLGSLRCVAAVQLDYLVDHEGGVSAPDSVTVTLSLDVDFADGDVVLVREAFDDSADPAFLGAVRSTIVGLEQHPARYLKMDFANDGQWTFLGEISFFGDRIPEAAFGITRVQTVGTSGEDVSINFKSQPQVLYFLERVADLPHADATIVQTDIKGTGEVAHITDAGGTQFQQMFYRVGIQTGLNP